MKAEVALLESCVDKVLNPLLLLKCVWDPASTGLGDRPERRIWVHPRRASTNAAIIEERPIPARQ